MPYIHFEKIWEDHDEMIQLMISMSNDSFRSTQDIYIYPDELISFGKELQDFPKNLDHQITFEYGSDEMYSHFILKTYIYDKAGHVKLEVSTDNNLESPNHESSHFFISTEASLLNQFGKYLCTWVNNMDEPLKYKW